MTNLHIAGHRLMIGYIQPSATGRLELGIPETIFPIRSTSGSVPVFIDPTRTARLTDEQILTIAAPHFEVSESRYGKDINPHPQYHGSDLSVIMFARRLIGEA
ncbi:MULTISPECIES: hypothetical protein [Burkholderia cepacia complex]|uniref:hypothetical protein n=1 Tax=Burkholderia cepacia complex TaxID=87882 RepID=UPI0013DDDEB4|nr:MULTISPECIES: hypothetical protein [Burkholderia cepacia complex]